MARRFGSAMMANVDSILGIYRYYQLSYLDLVALMAGRGVEVGCAQVFDRSREKRLTLSDISQS